MNTNNPNEDKNFYEFKLLEKSDIPDVLKLMKEFNLNIGGVRYSFLYKALCKESLVDERVLIPICKDNSKAIAFRLIIIDRSKWRISFLCRHPFLSFIMAAIRIYKRIFKILRKIFINKKPSTSSNFDISNYLSPGTTDRSWHDSSPEIAKSLAGGVTGEYRGKRILKQLHQYDENLLSKMCVKRIDSIILTSNISMIRATARLGVKIYQPHKGSVFTTKDIF